MSSLGDLKKTIESLNKTRQLEILKIFLKNNIDISENKNGSFVNLTYLSESCLEEVRDYISYITDQENTLETLENVKLEFIKEHFDNKTVENSNKDTPEYTNSSEYA